MDAALETGANKVKYFRLDHITADERRVLFTASTAS